MCVQTFSSISSGVSGLQTFTVAPQHKRIVVAAREIHLFEYENPPPLPANSHAL